MADDLDALRHIEGFPIGEDEDILALSDPPYYTAYPNPHIAEIIEKWNAERPEPPEQDYHREPYVSDVSEGKSDPIYNAHSYHTKVPHRAIMPFIKHYTHPGDIIFDGFCGTGMTGVAARLLGRRAILCDLSPAASFIAYNYNAAIDAADFGEDAHRLLKDVDQECSWMHTTWHPDCWAAKRVEGAINYTVWSDVFICPYCSGDVIFSDAAVDEADGSVKDSFPCPGCGATIAKRSLRRATETVWDDCLSREMVRARQVPVLINYSVNGVRYEKRPDQEDIALISKIEGTIIPHWYPALRMPEGDEARRNDPVGITHVHHFFTKRNLWVLAAVFEALRRSPQASRRALTFTFEQAIMGMSRWARYVPTHYSQVNQGLSGTLYLGSQTVEVSLRYIIGRKIQRLIPVFRALSKPDKGTVVTTTQSCTDLRNIPPASIDYIYTDPPFGSNLMYSDLNFIVEAWLRALTNNAREAVVSQSQHKALLEYRQLMTLCFSEMYRVLKPGRWITVVFHNSKASVWNAIQESLAHAGFLVAQVTILDKKQKTFKQVTGSGAVKNDLVINAYRPLAALEQRLIREAGHALERDLVLQHLKQLPVTTNTERSREMLYSKYLAYYVQRGFEVVYNANTFYHALARWGLEERDGYWFTPEQVPAFEERKKSSRLSTQEKLQTIAFVSDERSAIQWLWGFLSEPRTYDEIYTAFVKALQTPEDQIPELRALLEENFVRTNGAYKRPETLTKAELEARRQEHLLHQFDEYLRAAHSGQRLKEVRKEAVLAGFTQAYRDKRWDDILRVGRRLDPRIVESSNEILDFIDIAETKAG